MIRDACSADASAIADIYNHYVLHTHITFEEVAVDAREMADRIVEVQRTLPWVVHESNGVIDGYAYAAKWRARAAYRHAVETTVYLRPDARGRGIGRRIYAHLLATLRSHHIHVAIGGIALPNDASIALHERSGFAKVAHFHEVGWKFERWIDVGYWECRLADHTTD